MGWLLLGMQLLFFLLLFLLSHLLRLFSQPVLIGLALGGLLLTGLGLLRLGRRSYSALPRPSRANELVRDGVYRYIRHPIYLGVMLIASAFVLSRPTLLGLLLWIAFVVVTDVKASLEERLMTVRHPGYQEYKQLTGKYLPFIR